MKNKWNINKSIEWLSKNAYSTSQHKCARHVRLALKEGGLDVSGHPLLAKDYKNFLLTKGFEEVTNSELQVNKKGDILVLDSCKGHNAGHIALFTGTDWYSDFKQLTPLGCKFAEGIIPRWSILRFV